MGQKHVHVYPYAQSFVPDLMSLGDLAATATTCTIRPHRSTLRVTMTLLGGITLDTPDALKTA